MKKHLTIKQKFVKMQKKQKNTQQIYCTKFSSFNEIDKEKFKLLILSGFNKNLNQKYFEYVNPKYVWIINTNDEYLGSIVVERIENNIYYIDKKVV